MNNDIEQQVKFKEIDQLHSTLMEFNKNSIEVKKLCAALFTAVPAFLYKINGDVFLPEFFLISLAACFAFLFVDAHYYYNQKKIRVVMMKIKKSLITDEQIGIPTKKVGFWGAIFNTSNIIYAFFIVVNVVFYVWAVL